MPNRICIAFRWLGRFELMALDESTTFDKSGKEPNPGHKFFEINGLFYNKLKCGTEECFAILVTRVKPEYKLCFD